MIAENLSWDSSFFGYPVVKITLESNEDESSLHNFILTHPGQFSLYYIFLPNEQFLSGEFLSRYNVCLVDQKLIYSKSLLETDARYYLQTFEEIKPFFHQALNDRLIELAISSGGHSRFRMDKNFRNDEFQRLYKEWITRSVDGSIADIVYIYEINNSILGLISCKKESDCVKIGLVAVHPDGQGMGIGTKLLNRVAGFAINSKYDKVVVATQRKNLIACKFYEKNGFQIGKEINIYHLWST